jgi:uncharacterized caspase-like protein
MPLGLLGCAAAACLFLCPGSPLLPPAGAGAGTTPYEKSWAVVIGIDRYQHWPHLQAGVADARAVADRLRAMGFDQITYLTNAEATRNRILTEIGTNLSKATGANDRVVIYFAGHGFTEELPSGEQVGYLIPVDCPQSNFFTNAISMQQIRETFSRMRAKHIYYVMDCCFSGYGFTRGGGVPPGARGYLQVVTEKRSVQMITAGRKGDLAHEQGGHGIFTLHLLRGLAGEADLNGDGMVTASELGGFVQPQVYAASGQKQLPQYGRLDGEGEVVFLVGEDSQVKQSRERLEALERELARLQDQETRLKGKKELLLADMMKLDVELRQLREQIQKAQGEADALKVSLDERKRPGGPPPAGSSGAAASRPTPGGITPSQPQSASLPPGATVARFVDNGDGTVTDTRSGLMWQRAGSAQRLKPGDARGYIQGLNGARFGGHSDWRVPSLEELKTLLLDAPVRGMRLDPAFDWAYFRCWSSTEYTASNLKHYAGIDLSDGTVLTRSEHAESYHIRAVRGPLDALKAK